MLALKERFANVKMSLSVDNDEKVDNDLIIKVMQLSEDLLEAYDFEASKNLLVALTSIALARPYDEVLRTNLQGRWLDHFTILLKKSKRSIQPGNRDRQVNETITKDELIQIDNQNLLVGEDLKNCPCHLVKDCHGAREVVRVARKALVFGGLSPARHLLPVSKLWKDLSYFEQVGGLNHNLLQRQSKIHRRRFKLFSEAKEEEQSIDVLVELQSVCWDMLNVKLKIFERSENLDPKLIMKMTYYSVKGIEINEQIINILIGRR